MEIRKLELISRPVQAVQFTSDNWEAVRAWVQQHLPFQNVVANESRLYLPAVDAVDILEPGDWVFYDEVDNVFRGATDDAVKTHYKDVTDLPEVGETAEEN